MKGRPSDATCARAARGARARRARRSCWPPTICGLAATSGSNSRSSSRIMSKSSTGSRPDALDTSTRCTSTLVRSMWRRNWCAEAVALLRALDQPGHVGDDEAAIAAQRHDAEVRRQRRERVVGDLRPRRGDAGDQRRLARVGKADQADIGEQLQLQVKGLLFAGLARLGPPRRAVGGRDEPRVAAAAASALGDEHAVALLGEVGRERRSPPSGSLLEDQRADRHLDLEVRGRCSRCGWSPARAGRAAP